MEALDILTPELTTSVDEDHEIWLRKRLVNES